MEAVLISAASDLFTHPSMYCFGGQTDNACMIYLKADITIWFV